MHLVLTVLLGLVLIAVLATLGAGFYSLSRGGEFARRNSNRLMRLRIALQFAAIVLLAAVLFTQHKG